MKIPDDSILTKFLIPCFSRTAEGTLQPLERTGPKNLRKYKHVEGDLTYLETTAGGLFRYQTDIRVFQGHDPDREQIWGMQVAADISEAGLAKAKLVAIDLLDFLFEARRLGYMRTLAFIDTGQTFSLFDIPRHERVGLRADSVLRYEENIDDAFDFFSGNEEISYRASSRSPLNLIYRAQIQGGRL
jgi:hypothetical protein